MSSRKPNPTAATRHAEFDAAGVRLCGSPGFLDGGLADCTDFLHSFVEIDEMPISPEIVATAADAWRTPGASIRIRSGSGSENLLASNATASGGLSLLCIEIKAADRAGSLAHRMLDGHPLPVWISDVKSGEIVFSNGGARALFEVDEDGTGLREIGDIFRNREENLHLLKELRTRGCIDGCVIRAETATGRALWLRCAARLLEYEGRQLVLIVLQDVTSNERHASDVLRSRDLLNDALRAVSVGFALFDEEDRLIVCNDRYRDINEGIAEFITPGMHWESLLREMTRRRIARHAIGREAVWVDEILRASETFKSFEIERMDGSVFSVEVHPTSLGGFIISETDITARRTAEQVARESEQILSKVLEASPANLCMSRIADGEIIYRSPASVDLFGPDTTARDQFVDPLDRADFLTELLPVGKIDDFRAESRDAAGRNFPALFSARVIEYRGEDVMVSTVTDLSERFAAEQSLENASIRLRDAIEALAEGFILYDLEERVVQANQRFLEMNAPHAHLIVPGTHTRDLLKAAVETGHLVDAEMWLADYEAELARGEGGSQRSFEFQLADGSWVNSMRRPTRAGGFVITWLDVTEQKRAELELRQVNDRLRDAIELLDEGFALYDAEDRLVTWNKRYEELNTDILHIIREGVTYGEILETAIEAHRLPPDEIEQVRESGRRDTGNYRRRFEFKRRDGRWFSVSRHPTSDDGFVITRLDITERKKAEAAQREADEMTRRILDACPVSLVMSRFPTGEILFRSDEARKNYGDREIVRDYWIDPAQQRRFLELIERDGGADDFEAHLKRIDETTVPVLLSARKVDFRGDPVVVTYTFDLTERIAMEQQLVHQREMLHQSEKLSALGELLAGVAHELNNPLSVVVGHSLMLQEEIEDVHLLARTEKISKAAERCSRIVKTFLAMARHRPAKLERIDVNEVIEAALDVAGYGLRSSGATVECQFAEDLPLVMADADQLAQVFANLIVNAEHVLADKGTDGRLRISTRLSKSGKEVKIDVADNGPGIPEAIRARIFEPFFTTKTVGKGTGIGLAFCHRIIDSHGGRITVDEAEGGGADFAIWLAAADSGPGAAARAEDLGPGRGMVLVIDDEPDVADLIAGVLSKDGYEVTTVGSAEAGLGALPGDYDIILSDLNMPGLGGRAFLSEVRRNWPNLEERIGFITGDTMSHGAEKFLELSGRPFLEKPVSPADLRRLAANIMQEP